MHGRKRVDATLKEEEARAKCPRPSTDQAGVKLARSEAAASR